MCGSILNLINTVTVFGNSQRIIVFLAFQCFFNSVTASASRMKHLWLRASTQHYSFRKTLHVKCLTMF